MNIPYQTMFFVVLPRMVDSYYQVFGFHTVAVFPSDDVAAVQYQTPVRLSVEAPDPSEYIQVYIYFRSHDDMDED